MPARYPRVLWTLTLLWMHSVIDRSRKSQDFRPSCMARNTRRERTLCCAHGSQNY
jgi:hypothetical protein